MPTEKQRRVGTDETMGTPISAKPVKLFVGMLSARSEFLDEAEGMLVSEFGSIDERSRDLSFDFTEYYTPTMGPSLLRRFVAFAELIEPDRLVEIKLRTNEMEEIFSRRSDAAVPRPVNLDPGCLSPSKIIMATTKDYSHRIYMGRGIYAEVTLQYHGGRYEPCEWTYPDYRTEDYQEFFAATRERFMREG